MAQHESSVNFRNLIQDLAEMYPFDVAEVVVVELVANSLDAKASRISINYDPRERVLTVEDNGNGMNAPQFEEYHDFAAGLKPRGAGIGFAGLGAKVSFNIADRVITETQSESVSAGSNWFLQSKRKLLWEDIQPVHLHSYGTRVEVYFRPNAKIPYSATEDLTALLRRHYLPLMDLNFLNLYEKLGFYSRDLRFVINGEVVRPSRVTEDLLLNNVREFFPKKAGKRYGIGIFGLAFEEYPVAPDICGVLLSTYGKIIKADLFNQFPGDLTPRLFGIVEVPPFVMFLTTAKTDFTRKGKHREFERLYGPIREEFKSWLKDLGVKTTMVEESDEAMKLERELKKLIDDVPELSEFFGFRYRKGILTRSKEGSLSAIIQEGKERTFPVGLGAKGEGPGVGETGDEPGKALVESTNGTQKAEPISRTARRGPKITFLNAPDRTDLSWVDGNTVVINVGHLSYTKVRSNNLARRLHCLFAIANAVQRFLYGESEKPDLMFTDRMMAAWGKK